MDVMTLKPPLRVVTGAHMLRPVDKFTTIIRLEDFRQLGGACVLINPV